MLCSSSRSHLRKLAAINAIACCSSTSHTFSLPISLNSLDREGVRLLSPRDSQILPKPVSGADDNRAGDTTKLKEDLHEDLAPLCYLVLVDQ